MWEVYGRKQEEAGQAEGIAHVKALKGSVLNKYQLAFRRVGEEQRKSWGTWCEK